MPLVDQLRTLSVSKLIMIVTILVALLPITILGYHVYHSAWNNSWREIHEKHQLLAQNLAVPLGTYVDDHRVMLSMIGDTISLLAPQDNARTSQLLQQSVVQSRGFNSLLLLDTQGNVLAHANRSKPFTATQLGVFAKEQCYVNVLNKKIWAVSKMKRDPLTQQPTMFMGTPILRKSLNR